MPDGEKKLMTLATEEAHRLQHDYVGTEHLLLGLLRDGRNAAVSLLLALGVDVDRLRGRLDQLVATGATPVPPHGHLPVTQRVRSVLEYALEEARDLGEDAIGPQHLVLGLLREGGGLAAQAFRELGVTLERARARLRRPDEPEEALLPDDLTERARVLLELAQEEARRLGHEAVGTEEMLLGMLRLASGVGPCVLRALGADPAAIRAEVEKQAARGPGGAPAKRLLYTKRARRALEYAMEEAGRFRHKHLGTEHLLCGLLRERSGIASQVLERLGVTLDAVRAKVPRPE